MHKCRQARNVYRHKHEFGLLAHSWATEDISLLTELERFQLLRAINISPLRGAEKTSVVRATPRALPTAHRTLLTLFVLLLTAHCTLLTSVKASNWTRQKSGTMAWLHAVYFLDQN